MRLRVFRWVVRIASPSLHNAHVDAMIETVALRLARARDEGGRFADLRLLTRELAGVLTLLWSERFDLWARTRRARLRQQRRYQAGLMDSFIQEISQAWRRLLHAPSFTTAAVLTLALAIGANTSIFAVVERIVLRPLPYPDSDRLIELDHGSQRVNVPAGMGLNQGLYFHYAERSRTIERAALYRAEDATVLGAEQAERIRIGRATPSLAAVLRVPPALGRWFTEQEGELGSANVAVLSHGYWTRRYGNRPVAIGETLTVAGVDAEIIGVMPPSFAFPEAQVELWMPIKLSRATGFGLWTWSGVARLAPQASVESARAEMASLIADLPSAYPNDPMAAGNTSIGLTFSGRTLKEATVGSVERALWTLMAAMGVVLLIACANVANLFLVRSELRQREIAVRRALGASRGKLARYFLTESSLLAAMAGSVGLAIAATAVQLLVRAAPANLPRLHEIRLDATVVAFAIAVSAFTAIVFGAVPLYRGQFSASLLADGGRWSSVSRRRHLFRHSLMGAQVALALVLLVASTLMVRSFQKMRDIDPGFDAREGFAFTLGLSARDYPDTAAAVRAHHDIIDGLSALPGVRSVAATSCLPLAGGCFGNTVRVEGRSYSSTDPPTVAMFRGVSGDFFTVMGIRLLRGRGLTRADVERQYPVVVISDEFARQFFPGEDPIGRRVASNRPPGADFEWLEIVGVAANMPTRALNETRLIPILYLPMSIAATPQNPLRGASVMVMSYVLRTGRTTTELLPMIRQVIGKLDRNLALAQARSLDDILARAAAQTAFTMVLIALAGGIALLLGVIGIYGVMSYIVSQRTGEIGVRLALGAAPGAVATQILRQGSFVALAGVAIGVAVALAGSRVMTSLLFGVSARDPLVFAGTAAVLMIVALLACWLPARRAARLNPIDALRT